MQAFKAWWLPASRRLVTQVSSLFQYTLLSRRTHSVPTVTAISNTQTFCASPMHDSAKRRHVRSSELQMLSPGQNTPFSQAAMVIFDEASGSKGADDDKDDQSDISAHLPSIARMIETIEMEEKEALERSRVDNAGEQA